MSKQLAVIQAQVFSSLLREQKGTGTGAGARGETKQKSKAKMMISFLDFNKEIFQQAI